VVENFIEVADLDVLDRRFDEFRVVGEESRTSETRDRACWFRSSTPSAAT
jgi:hypothetical protein